MKTIKLLFSAILMMVAFTVQAQTVQVYKNGAVVKEYPASEVKSVEVKQVYYYYVGFDTAASNTETASSLLTNTISNFTTAASGTTLVTTDKFTTTPSAKRTTLYYIIPDGTIIYDDALNLDAEYVSDPEMRIGEFSYNNVKYLIIGNTNVKTPPTVYLVKK